MIRAPVHVSPVSIRIDESQRAALDALARERGVPLSDVLRAALAR